MSNGVKANNELRGLAVTVHAKHDVTWHGTVRILLADRTIARVQVTDPGNSWHHRRDVVDVGCATLTMRVRLAGYALAPSDGAGKLIMLPESLFGIPASCEVCGDDTDLHEWWDVDVAGSPVNCDRRV